MILAFVDQQHAAGHAVESIVAALNTGGLKIAARTLRTWRARTTSVPDRTVLHAKVQDVIRGLAFRITPDEERVLAPEGLYGRRKMLAAVLRR